MKVLVACEESQAVCKAFRELGHEAYSCDIQECSGGHPEWHIRGDVLEILNPHPIEDVCAEDVCEGIEFCTDDREYHFIEKWDLLIAHPPCTYLTNGSAVRLLRKESKLYPGYGIFQMVNVERLKKGIVSRDFFMAFMNADIERIAIENPVPIALWMLPKYSQIIQPYQFGHKYSKKTCLWLKRLPLLKPTQIITEGVTPWVNGGCKDAHGNYRRVQGRRERDPKNRSKTFPGIAKAMAEQWGGLCE